MREKENLLGWFTWRGSMMPFNTVSCFWNSFSTSLAVHIISSFLVVVESFVEINYIQTFGNYTYCTILDPKSSRNSSLLWDILIFVFTDTSSLLIALANISSALSTLTGCFWYSMSSNCMYNFSLDCKIQQHHMQTGMVMKKTKPRNLVYIHCSFHRRAHKFHLFYCHENWFLMQEKW